MPADRDPGGIPYHAETLGVNWASTRDAAFDDVGAAYRVGLEGRLP